MAGEQVENHGDSCAPLEILQHDELPHSRGVDSLRILVNQQKASLRVEGVAAGLQTDYRSGAVRGRRPTIGGLQISEFLGQEIAVGSKLKCSPDRTVGKGPDVLFGIEIRLRTAVCKVRTERNNT